MIKALYIVLAALLLSAVASPGEALLPVGAQRLTEEVLEDSSVYFSDDWQVRQSRFDQHLQELAASCDEEVALHCREREGQAMEFKIVVMAINFKASPARFQELIEKCLQLPPPEITPPGSPRYAPPDERYISEEWRLPWEFMLMRPAPGLTNFRSLEDFYETVVLEALLRINSPASQVLFEHCFRVAANSSSSWADRGQPWRSLLEGMAHQQTPESFNRMVRCLGYLKNRPGDFMAARQMLMTVLVGIPAEAITYKSAFLKREGPVWRKRRLAWEKVLRGMISDAMPLESRDIIKEVLDTPQY